MRKFLRGDTEGGGKNATVDSLIGRHTEILGDVRFSGGLHLDGRIKGAVTASGGEASNTFSVSEAGAVEGDIRVPNVILNGTVIGNVHASSKLVLNAKARVNGDVHYKALQMEAGATINGQLVHDTGASAASTRSESAVLDIQDARRGKLG
ncbi:MAG: polymer-forming cytoskeletal protein [Gammaproteobacteria bacterium]|jgi:cytoskeletal protein CcmA (bactofilin family)|uniref:bactofilin family protein n=1 Tax=Nevskia sp. TaxID=1929292 RepID=UPI0040358C8C|nr:polymer-forming cytoskeletal protein [Gammaproteobacteria bacterium]